MGTNTFLHYMQKLMIIARKICALIVFCFVFRFVLFCFVLFCFVLFFRELFFADGEQNSKNSKTLGPRMWPELHVKGKGFLPS